MKKVKTKLSETFYTVKPNYVKTWLGLSEKIDSFDVCVVSKKGELIKTLFSVPAKEGTYRGQESTLWVSQHGKNFEILFREKPGSDLLGLYGQAKAIGVKAPWMRENEK